MDTPAHTFVVIYSGRTIADARIVAASSDADLVAVAVEKMMLNIDREPSAAADPVLMGRRSALDTIKARVK